MRSAIIEAIQSLRLLSLWYDPGMRVAEPHVLGYGSDGQLLLRALQIKGASASSEHFNWKLFRLDRMRNATLNGGSFSAPTTPEYNRNDRAMKRGIITVSHATNKEGEMVAGTFHGMSIEAAVKKLLNVRKRPMGAQDLASDLRMGGLLCNQGTHQSPSLLCSIDHSRTAAISYG